MDAPLPPVLTGARALRKSLIRLALKTGFVLSGTSIKARDESIEGRDLTGRANGTIDPFYGCDLLDEAISYALNFSVPWSKLHI